MLAELAVEDLADKGIGRTRSAAIEKDLQGQGASGVLLAPEDAAERVSCRLRSEAVAGLRPPAAQEFLGGHAALAGRLQLLHARTLWPPARTYKSAQVARLDQDVAGLALLVGCSAAGPWP